MILYHFCPAHLVRRIQRYGLTLGHFPMYANGEWTFLSDCQWLTVDPDRNNQSWATMHLIDYDRTEYRLTIDIPERHCPTLFRAVDYVKRLPEEDRKIIDGWEGSENWYIFRGKIPPKWIVAAENMEGAGHDH